MHASSGYGDLERRDWQRQIKVILGGKEQLDGAEGGGCAHDVYFLAVIISDIDMDLVLPGARSMSALTRRPYGLRPLGQSIRKYGRPFV